MATLANVLATEEAERNQSRQASIIALNACMSTLATVAVVCRLWARKVVGVPWKADDYTIVASLILSYALLIAAMLSVHNGLGKHLLTESLEEMETYLKTFYIYLVIYPVCLPMVKISILLFYRRIFRIAYFTLLLNFVGTFVLLWAISGVLVAVFQCQPVSVFWNKLIAGGCINTDGFVLAEAGITIATDIIVLILPLPMIWRLKISKQQKWAVSGVFMLGSFVCIASIARLPSLTQDFTLDQTWTGYAPAQWSSVEVNLAIVCACLPIMRPLFRRRVTPTTRPSDLWPTYSSGNIVSTVEGGRTGRKWWPMKHESWSGSLQNLDGNDDDPWGPSTRSLMRQGILRTTTLEFVETWNEAPAASGDGRTAGIALPEIPVAEKSLEVSCHSGV